MQGEKRGLVYYLLKVLVEYSDEEHLLTQKEIIKHIENIFHVTYDRKTIASGLKFLEDNGVDIYKGDTGICLGERLIELNEFSFIVDALFSSRSISPIETKKLYEQLSKCFSKYQRKEYEYVYKVNDVTKSNNDVFHNIYMISEAISKKKKISFLYGGYDDTKKLVPRNNGDRYVVSPYYLVNSLSRYYLLSSNDKYEEKRISTYRVDFLLDIAIEDERSENKKEIFGENFSIDTYLNEHIYLFGGEVVNAKIQLENETAINYIVDWFGNNASIYKEKDKYFADIRSNEDSLFYWCLQYGRLIKVITPKSLVNKIVDENKKILEKYSNN